MFQKILVSTFNETCILRFLRLTLFAEGCKSRVVGCGPDCWSIPHTVCSSGQCSCDHGYLPHYSGAAGKLSMCLSSVSNSSLQSDQASSGSGNTDINIHYYPGTNVMAAKGIFGNWFWFSERNLGFVTIHGKQEPNFKG